MLRSVRILSRRLQSIFQRSRVESDLDREIGLHLEQLTKEYIADGMTEAEARLAARREFGTPELSKEECRDMRRVNWFEDLLKDVLYSFRVMKRSPGFTLTAVVSLALGIGANTVVFSALNALLLKPLPIHDAGRVFFVSNSGFPSNSFPNYRDIRDRNQVFESLFAFRIAQMSVDRASGGGGSADRVWGFLVTGNYFDGLGIKPAAGRLITPADDGQAGASPYAVLSYACWQNRFGGDPAIAGREVRINNRPYTVLGVAERGFHGTEVFYWPEIWVPMAMQPHIEGNSWLDSRFNFNAWIAGRLKPGVTPAQAEAHLSTIANQLAREYTVNEGMVLTLAPPGMAGGKIRGMMTAFADGVMLLAALTLLAACANLAGLLTARATDREREMAVRISIGAGRARLVRQLLTESVLTSAIGGAAGCGLAVLLLEMLTRWRAPLDFPIQFDVMPDWRVFLFAFGVSLLTGALFGAGPVRRAWATDPALSLKGSAAPSVGGRWGGRDLLLPVQIALCCLLLTASLAAVRGLVRSIDTPLGFRPGGGAVIGIDVGLGGYDKVRGQLFQERVLEEARRIPGVESAAYGNSVPLSIDHSTNTVYPERTTDFRPKNSFRSSKYDASPNYFRTLGTALLSGRDFHAQDGEKSPPVAIVNQTYARMVLGTTDAVGHRVVFGPRDSREIVGMVEDGKYETLTEEPAPVVFLPIAQNYSRTMVLIARSRRPEIEVANEMRQVVNRIDPHLAVYGVGGLRQMLGFVYLPMRAAAITLGAFGVLALMLAITGIYGLSAYTVSRRSREIGIRMAIGARPAQVLKFVFGRIGSLVTVGALAGLALGIAGASVLASIVYHATSRDPVVIGGAVLTICAVAFVASFGPARRAVRMNPVQSLRQD